MNAKRKLIPWMCLMKKQHNVKLFITPNRKSEERKMLWIAYEPNCHQLVTINIPHCFVPKNQAKFFTADLMVWPQYFSRVKKFQDLLIKGIIIIYYKYTWKIYLTSVTKKQLTSFCSQSRQTNT